MSATHLPETAVPDGESPAAVCPYCERPFRTARRCTLHVGEAHADCTPEERDAYQEARDEEGNDLFIFHLKVMFALGAVYAAFVVVFVVAFSLAG